MSILCGCSKGRGIKKEKRGSADGTQLQRNFEILKIWSKFIGALRFGVYLHKGAMCVLGFTWGDSYSSRYDLLDPTDR